MISGTARDNDSISKHNATMYYSETIIALFKKHGMKITPQRLAVVNALDGDRSHPTAEDIFNRLKSDYPSLSFTTVYNILKSIKTVGGVQELIIDRDRVHYDPDTSTHHHIFCTECGRLDDVFYVNPPEIEIPECIKSEYYITGHQINFFGLCGTCVKSTTDH